MIASHATRPRRPLAPVGPFAGLLTPLFWGLALFLGLAPAPAARAQTPLNDLVSAVVGIKTFIDPEGRTVENLGRERQGSGIVIDENGLVLTIGYLMVEAHAAVIVTNTGRSVPADVVGYDHESGFGLLRAIEPLRLKPMPLGRSAPLRTGDPVLVVAAGGIDAAMPARIAAIREFAGSWEYLLDDAIFTTPPHPAWSGAALVNREGRLVGVGSLIVGNAAGEGDAVPGNMFVPIDRLTPILADLIAEGRVSAPARPWLGLNAEEISGRLFVSRVTPGGPAEKAGIGRGDIIVGVAGEPPKSLADFYRRVWALGSAGVKVPLDVLRGADRKRIEVTSMNRLDHLRLKSTF